MLPSIIVVKAEPTATPEKSAVDAEIGIWTSAPRIADEAEIRTETETAASCVSVPLPGVRETETSGVAADAPSGRLDAARHARRTLARAVRTEILMFMLYILAEKARFY